MSLRLLFRLLTARITGDELAQVIPEEAAVLVTTSAAKYVDLFQSHIEFS